MCWGAAGRANQPPEAGWGCWPWLEKLDELGAGELGAGLGRLAAAEAPREGAGAARGRAQRNLDSREHLRLHAC